jgi:hypothetical protein
MDADMPFFNMAIHSLADEQPEEAMCFTLYYFHRYRPVKKIAATLGIGTRTFYDRMHRFSRRAHQLSRSIKRVHMEHTGGNHSADSAAQNSTAQIASF